MEKGKGTTIHFNTNTVENLSGRVHQLPCCVKYDGVAAVSQYFKPKLSGVHSEDEGLQLLKAHFRGRLLQGATLHLPHPYTGFVLEKNKIGDEENSSTSWHTNATFHDVTYWNHDDLPCHNDHFFRAFHYLTIANALHKPVTPEDLASTSTLF
ncbi:hypothetical protein Lal_00046906 [Lupinus albus]|uniref:Putative ribonuclease H n=1 Tax=Lupinus albus TaxID=3870 RepID=A0A6A5N4P3_LUPAL|nr:putative ribonuclease H [Lupinus albus]KAF1878240.1 hypothetical protein Lal_00046906 [Lupinus albus]